MFPTHHEEQKGNYSLDSKESIMYVWLCVCTYTYIWEKESHTYIWERKTETEWGRSRREREKKAIKLMQVGCHKVIDISRAEQFTVWKRRRALA